MFDWYKRLDAKLKERLSNVNLFKKYPNYFISKAPFQVAAAMILFISIFVWAIGGFALTNVYISCPANSPTPCYNPVYVCPPVNMLNSTYGGGYFFHDGVRCNNIPSWVCEQVPCNISRLQPGEHYGKKSVVGNVLVIDLVLILWAFVVNHALYMYPPKNRSE